MQSQDSSMTKTDKIRAALSGLKKAPQATVDSGGKRRSTQFLIFRVADEMGIEVTTRSEGNTVTIVRIK